MTNSGRQRFTVSSTARLPRLCPREDRSQQPFGGEWLTSTAPMGHGARRAAAASSLRSKLHEPNGVTGTPPPKPKKVMPAMVTDEPCKTWADVQLEQALLSSS